MSIPWSRRKPSATSPRRGRDRRVRARRDRLHAPRGAVAVRAARRPQQRRGPHPADRDRAGRAPRAPRRPGVARGGARTGDVQAPGRSVRVRGAFARALQRVQIELAHSVTPIDILDDSPEEAPTTTRTASSPGCAGSSASSRTRRPPPVPRVVAPRPHPRRDDR
jgi:hypothetical protein